MARTKKKLRTRTVAILAGIAVVVAGGGIAFAYFTNVGSGSGSAGTGSNNPVVVKQTSTVTAMGPGVAPQALSGNFDNTNSGPVYIAYVKAVVSSVTPSTANANVTPACATTDFTIAGGNGTTAQGGTSATLVGAQVPAGTAQGAWSGLTLAFNNTTANQDACKNSTVTLTYTAG